MRNGLKRAAAFALTILMLLTLLPAALATEVHSDGVVPGLSDGGELAGLLDAANSSDETVSANALLAAYGGISALAEGEVIGERYYKIMVDGAELSGSYEASGNLTSGEITENNVPSVTSTGGSTPLEFVGAFISNAPVLSVGKLTHQEKEYIYYTTEDNNSTLAATVLGEGEKIELRYTTASEVTITYTVTGDWDRNWEDENAALDEIFGADRPTTVLTGGSYNVTAEIPRGYKATVTVNGDERTVELGAEPEYTRDGNIIKATGEPYTLEKLIAVSNVSGAQNIQIDLTKREYYQFSADLWSKTDYVMQDGPRATFSPETTSMIGDGGNSQLLLTMVTSDAYQWEMDSLQINGVPLNIPYIENQTSTRQPVTAITVLPSGTEVTLTVECRKDRRDENYVRTYKLYVSNCYEDITITGGNLNQSSGWHEIIPTELTGVEFQVKDHQIQSGGKWSPIAKSQPFSVSEVGNYMYELGTYEIRFKLLPGYVSPDVNYSRKDVDNLNHLCDVREPSNDDGWYYIKISKHGCATGKDDAKFTFLSIEAELGQYSVTYNSGDVVSDADVPEDTAKYNIVDNATIPISNVIPTDPNGTYAFQYWTLDGYEDAEGNPIQIKPGSTLDLATVAAYADQNQHINLTAVWQEAATAELITYYVEFYKDGEAVDGERYPFQAPREATVAVDANADEVQAFLQKYPAYRIDPNTSDLFKTGVQHGDVLEVYFVKATTDVTIAKQVTGNMGDRTKAFGFEVTSTEPIGAPTEGEYTLSSDGTTAIFSLANAENVTLQDVPIGATLTIKEEGADTYTVMATGAQKVEGENATFTATVLEDMGTITVKNEKEATPDTGIVTDSLPYIVILACVVAIGAVVIVRRRGRRDE